MEPHMFSNLSLKTYLLCKRLQSDTEGATMVEYSILIGLITAVVVAAVSSIGVTAGVKWDALDALFN
jgi:Flp pilus assembly pilin Flp